MPGKGLAGFEPGRGLGGAEYGQVSLAEVVHDSRRKGGLRPNYREIDGIGRCYVGHLDRIVGNPAQTSGMGDCPWSGVHLVHFWAFGQDPGQSVLPGPRTNDEDLHLPSLGGRVTGRDSDQRRRYSHSMVPGGLLVMS